MQDLANISMGVSNGEPAGRTAVRSGGKSSIAVHGRLRSAGPCQHVMGLFDGESAGRTAVHSVSEGSRATSGQFQRAGLGQYSMGACDCELV